MPRNHEGGLKRFEKDDLEHRIYENMTKHFGLEMNVKHHNFEILWTEENNLFEISTICNRLTHKQIA
ncbi:CLUMA_CG021187, isoform A [Clunio marinus]|uniref:CLUMA_CG021187, isoform A n=1 Tax=Clunio marinus TaxID=568069 RepID=A0A1J1JAI4_9DIPT|nr:CLUMA_CG021187, isoform A [Clunio marinus]